MLTCESRIVYLQRCQDAARSYTWFITGTCPAADSGRLVAKFSRTYETGISPSSKSKRKRSGFAVASAYGYRLPSGDLRFTLFVTDGAGLVHNREKLSKLGDCRVTDGDLELVHDGKTWSWRLRREALDKWRDRIHREATRPPERRTIVDGTDADAERLLDQLYALPGFRGVRSQVGDLVHLLVSEFRRHRPDGTAPKARTFLPYVQRLANRQNGPQRDKTPEPTPTPTPAPEKAPEAPVAPPVPTQPPAARTEPPPRGIPLLSSGRGVAVRVLATPTRE